MVLGCRQAGAREMAADPIIRGFFDEPTNAVSYLVGDPLTGQAAAIDPVLDFDPASGVVATASAGRLLDAAAAEGWTIAAVLETHPHADHLTAADYLRHKTGAWVGIGEHIRDVQGMLAP